MTGVSPLSPAVWRERASPRGWGLLSTRCQSLSANRRAYMSLLTILGRKRGRGWEGQEGKSTQTESCVWHPTQPRLLHDRVALTHDAPQWPRSMALFLLWICVLSAYCLLDIIVYIKHNIILEMSWTIHNLHYRENHSLCIKRAGDSVWLFITQLAHLKMATVISHEFLYPWKKRGLTSEKPNPCYSLITIRSASTWLKKQTRNCYAYESLWKPRFVFARAGQVFVVILSKPHISLLNLSRELWIAKHVLYTLKGASRNFVNPIIGLS